MTTALLIALFGGLGAVGRYLITKYLKSNTFPVATFLINCTGSFFIGLLYTVSKSPLALILGIGFLGGFTTFSTYMFESITLWQRKQVLTMIFYSVGSLIFGVLLAILGAICGRAI
jgi:fluoride exporter